MMNMNDIRPDAIFTYCHIQKVGGTTWLTLLRRYWGLRHQELVTRAGQVLLPHQMERDLSLNPLVRSIASHGTWPCMNYGRYDDRLVWYVSLRDPVARYLSHYQHHAERWATHQPFEEWLDIEMQKNWQTKVICGQERPTQADLERAKEILAAKMRVVGILERFNESCLLFRRFLDWDGFKVTYGEPRNTARKGAAAQRVREDFDKYRERIIENNALDIALYEYAASEIYPRQVEAYGEEQLRRDLATEFGEDRPTMGERLREFESNALRRYVYRPFILAGDILHGRRRGRGGTSDQRLVVDDNGR